jgi:catechol 2,3-dioxygenase-like lactoylglutathione lyase family enzyme
MATLGSLFAVTIDCPDPLSLARFYQQITNGKLLASNEDFVVLTTEDNIRLDFQRVANHRPAPWPDPAAPLRLHLDFRVDDLDRTQAHLLNLGAVRPEFQPGGQRFRVLLDPAGHPFCIATKEAAATPHSSPARHHGDLPSS